MGIIEVESLVGGALLGFDVDMCRSLCAYSRWACLPMANIAGSPLIE